MYKRSQGLREYVASFHLLFMVKCPVINVETK